MLAAEFAARAEELPGVFDPAAPAVALRPSVAAPAVRGVALGPETPGGGQPAANDAVFEAPDAFGWAYQYWNTEEKDRVFDEGPHRGRQDRRRRHRPGHPALHRALHGQVPRPEQPRGDLGGDEPRHEADIRLGVLRTRRGPHAGDPPAGGRDHAARPGLGSGHFLLEAFDLFWGMYEEEGAVQGPEAIAAAILNHNLFGIDIDERAVQIAQAALWMKAKERWPDLSADDVAGFRDHLVATNIRLPRGDDHVRTFLKKHPEDDPLRHALPAIFEGLSHAHVLGSLLKVEEIVEAELAAMRRTDPLFAYSMAAEGWKDRVMTRLREHFDAEARVADLAEAFFSRSAGRGLALFDLLQRRYDTVVANPPTWARRTWGLVKRYLERHYGPGKRDLYAAFILRNLELAAEGGRVAMVSADLDVPPLFADLRATRQRLSGGFGAGPRSPIEGLAHLGPQAFSEITRRGGQRRHGSCSPRASPCPSTG